MFVGHALLAFGLLALATRRRGLSADRAFVVAAVAALFATLPDVDMAHALVGVVGAAGGDVWTLSEGFWAASTVVHRAVTHSALLAAPAAAAFALWPAHRRVATALLAGLVAVAFVASGSLAAAVMALFCLVGIAVAIGAAVLGVGARGTFVAAFVGLFTHPFGDLFTGDPPRLLYPLGADLVGSRVAPFRDPTLDLLAAFGAELVAVWFGVAVAVALSGRRFRDLVDARAALGAGYAAAAFVLPPPTMATSYQFVFSILAVGIVGIVPTRRPRSWQSLSPTATDAARVATTGLTAVTVAGLAYTVAYLVA